MMIGTSAVLSLRGGITLSYLGILAAASLADWNTRVIPDFCHVMIMLLGVVTAWMYPEEHTLTERLIGALIISVPMLFMAVMAGGAFGGGDIKLTAASGWLLGWQVMLPAAAIGILSGGSYCIWMLAKGKLTRKGRIAFGPFLAAGLSAACLFGEEMLEWYLGRSS